MSPRIARFAPYLAESMIVPVVVDMPVERLGPGHFRQGRTGRLVVATSTHGEEFSSLFRGTNIHVETTTDFISEAWRKLAHNCAGAVPALLMKPASIVRSAPIAAIMRELVEECVAVGRAEGASFDADFADRVLNRYRDGPPGAINSLHADRIAGKPLEIDARNGAVVRFGQKHGISTPANRIFVGLLLGSTV
ncbi:hypothetical protein HB777_22455 [Mesorhizobium loti]|nr:hypothetical protein HB777_22455 [Mesorhizobium loti]